MTLIRSLKKLKGLEDLAIVKIKAGVNCAGCLRAYAMDEDCIKNKKERSIMKKVGNMDSCHSCDYLYLMETGDKELRGYIIEETDLVRTMYDRKEEFKEEAGEGICNDFLEKCIERYLMAENRIKLYSSLLILCRLCNQFKDIDKLWQKIEFYFVLLLSNNKTMNMAESGDINIYDEATQAYEYINGLFIDKTHGIPVNVVKIVNKNKIIFSYEDFKEHITNSLKPTSKRTSRRASKSISSTSKNN